MTNRGPQTDFAVIGNLGFYLPADEAYINSLGLAKVVPDSFTSGTVTERNRRYLPSHCALIERMLNFARHNSLRTTVLDIGGYIGMFGIPIGAMLKDSKNFETEVHIFEPTPLCECIERSVKINGLEAVVSSHRAAVSSSVGILGYYARSGNRIAGRLFPFKDAKRLYDVPTVTIDNFLEEHEVPGLLIAKVDTEGHEVAVLSGGARILGRIPTVVVLELWPWLRAKTIGDETYCAFLTRHFHLFDIVSSVHPKSFQHISEKYLVDFLDKIAVSHRRTTDILCISKTLGSPAEVTRLFLDIAPNHLASEDHANNK